MPGRLELPRDTAAVSIQRHARGMQQRKVQQQAAFAKTYEAWRNADEEAENHAFSQRNLSGQLAVNIKQKPSSSTKHSTPPARVSKCDSDDELTDMLGEKLDLDNLTQSSARAVLESFKRDPKTQLPTAVASGILRRIHELLTKTLTSAVVDLPVPEGDPPRAPGRVLVIGDLHGQFQDLAHIFFTHGEPSLENVYLFNGDIADRGKHAVEIFLVLFLFKLLEPGSVHINRGNHEVAWMNEMYGFEAEVEQKYPTRVFKKFQQIFDVLPFATVLVPSNSSEEKQQRILVIHGGLWEEEDFSLDDLRKVDWKRPIPQSPFKSISHQVLSHCVWSDPMQEKGFASSKRGHDCLKWGPDVTGRFLKQNGVDKIFRSHSVPTTARGYEGHHGDQVYTIFSASNYCGKAGNYGGVSVVQSNMTFEFHEFYAIELQELLELEKRSSEVAGNLSDVLQEHREKAKQKEEKLRMKQMQKSMNLMEEEMLDSLKVKLCERRDQLESWYETQDQGNTGQVKPNVFHDGLVAVLSKEQDYALPELPWGTISNRLRLVDERTSLVHYHKFLRRFRVELADLNSAQWKRQIIHSTFKAIMKTDLSLRDTLAVFDKNNDGRVAFPEFCEVMEALGLNLRDQELHAFFRSFAGDLSHGHVDVEDFLGRLQTMYASVKDDGDASPSSDYGSPVSGSSSPSAPRRLRHILFGKSLDSEEVSSAKLLRRFFEEADVDGSGFLDYTEVVESVKKLPGLSQRLPRHLEDAAALEGALVSICQEVDVSRNGQISFAEFLHAFHPPEEDDTASWMDDVLDNVVATMYENRACLRSALRTVDTDEDGAVDENELQVALVAFNESLNAGFSDSEIDAMITNLSFTDGLLHYDELLASFVIVDRHCPLLQIEVPAD